jgi:hypothetical protein
MSTLPSLYFVFYCLFFSFPSILCKDYIYINGTDSGSGSESTEEAAQLSSAETVLIFFLFLLFLSIGYGLVFVKHKLQNRRVERAHLMSLLADQDDSAEISNNNDNNRNDRYNNNRSSLELE